MPEDLDAVLASLADRWTDSYVLAFAADTGALVHWWSQRDLDGADSSVGLELPAQAVEAARGLGRQCRPGANPLVAIADDWQLTAGRLRRDGNVMLLVVVRPRTAPAADRELTLAIAAGERLAGVRTGPRSRLDDLVTDVATSLAGITAEHLEASLREVVELVGRFFDVDTCFLRRHDLEARASVLVAEWPQREQVADPDPLGVVPFDVDDPVFGAIETLAAPLVIMPSSAAQEYQQRVFAGSGVAEVSLAMVPLQARGDTTGVLGFIHFGEHRWSHSEIGALAAIASVIAQVLARVDAERRLHVLAFCDTLTGLPNRRAFLDHIEARLARSPREPFALASIDLDRLKTMNDVFGHAAGDDMIVSTADCLASAIEPDDLAARLGGDEFVVVFDGVASAMLAQHRAEQVLTALRNPVSIGPHPMQRRASLGVTVCDERPRSADEVLRAADVALLEAKARGGNQIVVFNQILERRSLQRADLELRIENALDSDEFELYFQPEFDLRSREVLAAEALVRWHHPERGLLPASEFISVVEETNYSQRLGSWVHAQGCRALRGWQPLLAGRQFTLRMNVTPGEFVAVDFVDRFEQTLADHQIDARHVCLEITETTVMRDVRSVAAALTALRRKGVLIAIDDFGTGHSSLAQLNDLPIDILKIDRGFVSRLGAGGERERGGYAIVAGIVGLAASLGLQTVAEGVETEAQAAILLDLGCRRAQGHLTAPALPAGEFAAFLDQAEPIRLRAVAG